VIVSCSTTSTSRSRNIGSEFLHRNILLVEPDLQRFAQTGPYFVDEQMDRDVTLDLDETIVVDHFSAKSKDRLPIIVISHGNFSSRKAHREQARHLASWGFNVVAFEVPNRDEWVENGTRLRRFIELLHRFPLVLGQNSDGERIIVVGHSFGGSAAVLAMGSGAPVIGAVLLDPAVVHQKVVQSMKSIDLPILLIGSDKDVFVARGRTLFSKNLQGEMVEVSVTNSTHDDAQGPSMFSRSALGFDPFTSGSCQRVFRSILTVASIGMATSGTLDFAKIIISRDVKIGNLKDPYFHENVR
jgi:dienelactone hydrolase